MSKQLTLSAAISTVVMAAFVLLATPGTNETGATRTPAAPAFEATLLAR